MRYIGVVRGSRIAKCPLTEDKLLKERGEFDYFSNVDCLFVKWNDNNRVICGRNFSSIEPLHKVKRFVKRQHLNISMSNLINQYNQHMGGVDNTNQYISELRPSLTGKNGIFLCGSIQYQSGELLLGG